MAKIRESGKLIERVPPGLPVGRTGASHGYAASRLILPRQVSRRDSVYARARSPAVLAQDFSTFPAPAVQFSDHDAFWPALIISPTSRFVIVGSRSISSSAILQPVILSISDLSTAGYMSPLSSIASRG